MTIARTLAAAALAFTTACATAPQVKPTPLTEPAPKAPPAQVAGQPSKPASAPTPAALGGCGSARPVHGGARVLRRRRLRGRAQGLRAGGGQGPAEPQRAVQRGAHRRAPGEARRGPGRLREGPLGGSEPPALAAEPRPAVPAAGPLRGRHQPLREGAEDARPRARRGAAQQPHRGVPARGQVRARRGHRPPRPGPQQGQPRRVQEPGAHLLRPGATTGSPRW